jgi:alanyl-tRNA synthetase
VRVLSFGDFSTELCGGTHVKRVGDIGLFKIVSEGGVAAGVRRIEAVTSEGAYEYVAQSERTLREVSQMLRAGREDLEDKVRQVLERQRRLEKEIATLKAKLASGQGSDLSSTAVDVGGIKVVATRIDGADAPALRAAVDQLKNKLKSAAIVLASVQDGKVILIAGVTADQTAVIKAGELVNVVAQKIGGRGGGRADLAQAGGNDPTKLDEALAAVVPWVESQRLVRSASVDRTYSCAIRLRECFGIHRALFGGRGTFRSRCKRGGEHNAKVSLFPVREISIYQGNPDPQ